VEYVNRFIQRNILCSHHQSARLLANRLRREHKDALFCRYIPEANLSIMTINMQAATPRRPAVVMVRPSELRLYTVEDAPEEALAFPSDALRWFGRPDIYKLGRNRLWLHVDQAERWHLIHMEPYQSTVARLVQALKLFAPLLETPYRRQRPYIHYGPVSARRATQDLYGVWTLHEAVDLYLMPLHLVLLDGETVRATLPVNAVTQVRGVQRVDAPGGVVQFEVSGTRYAYAVERYRELAESLAEAAKRSLEQPLEMLDGKRKKKKDE
jgi:hypothetical protein